MIKLYSPKTLDEYRDARNHKLADPENVDIILTGDILDDIIMRMTAIEVWIEETKNGQ